MARYKNAIAKVSDFTSLAGYVLGSATPNPKPLKPALRTSKPQPRNLKPRVSSGETFAPNPQPVGCIRALPCKFLNGAKKVIVLLSR